MKMTASQIIFDSEDFVAGLAKNAAVKATYNNSNQLVTNFDPFRDYGIAQPGRKPTAATNNSGLGGVLVAGAVKSSTVAYGLDSAGKIHEYTYSTNTLTTGSFPYTISGTSPVGQDCLIYKHNSGGTTEADKKFSTFFSYYNNANWDVCALVNQTGTPDYDFMSTIPATPLDITSSNGDSVNERTMPHPMEIGSDDQLYIGSGRYLHAYDGATGTNGTFYAKVLSLPLGFVITGLLKYKDKMLIAGTYSSIAGAPATNNNGSGGEALVYVWNYTDLDINQVIPLDDPICSSIFMWRGIPHMITVGESEGFGTLNGTKLKRLNGDIAEKLAEFYGDVAYRGVDGSARVLYLNSNGKIYTIGDNIKDGYPVNQIMSCTQTGVGGWIKNVLTYNILSSGSTGAAHSLDQFSAYATSGRIVTSYYGVPMSTHKKMRVKDVVVEFYSTCTSAKAELTLQLAYDMNCGPSNSTVISSLNTVAAPAQKVYYVDTSGSAFQPFSNIALDMSWSEDAGNANATAPQVSRVVVDYEPIEI